MRSKKMYQIGQHGQIVESIDERGERTDRCWPSHPPMGANSIT